jgi:hypothetical protein
VKDAVSDLVLKEAETQRHLTNMYAELSELRRKVEIIPGAWQYQHAGGNNGTMVVQHGGAVEIHPAAGVGNSVDNAVRRAVTGSVRSVAGGSVGNVNDFLDDVPSGGEGEMSVEQVLQGLDPNGGVDPSLLDEPCEPEYEPCDDGSPFCY